MFEVLRSFCLQNASPLACRFACRIPADLPAEFLATCLPNSCRFASIFPADCLRFPAELPGDLRAFRRAEHRGSTEVARIQTADFDECFSFASKCLCLLLSVASFAGHFRRSDRRSDRRRDRRRDRRSDRRSKCMHAPLFSTNLRHQFTIDGRNLSDK